MSTEYGKFSLLFLVLLLVTLAFSTSATPSAATTVEVQDVPLRSLHVFEEIDGKHVVCALDGTDVERSDVLHVHSADRFTYVPPPANFRQRAANSATINVTYTGFTPEAQAAFQFAVDIWQSQITSNVPIEVQASFEALPSGVLGSAGAGSLRRNWSNAPLPNTWYPIALANKIAGEDLRPDRHDITARFSSVRDDWYFGTDGNTPADKIDFVSVVLHEIGHGLGFSGSATVSAGEGSLGGDGLLYVYDTFVKNGAGTAITSYSNPSEALGAQLQGGDLFFDGSTTNAANNGSPPELYAPNPFRQGSSFSHLDEEIFAPGNPNSLMSPSIGSGEAIHDPGPITRAMFTDMGWTTSSGLPIVASVYLPVLTNTLTKTELESVPVENGDFESGRTVWTQYSDKGSILIFKDLNVFASVSARNGTWAAWLGGRHNEISYIEQELTIPSNAPYFTYWSWIVSSEDNCGNDVGKVLLNGNVVATYELCSSNNTNGWQARSVDLSDFAGQTVPIQIRVQTNDSIFSNLFIDDIVFLNRPERVGQPNQVTPSEWEAIPKEDVMQQGSEASYLTPLLRLEEE